MKRPTLILGISAFYHDSAAALLCDGEVVAAAQEERFTRKKGDARVPLHAIRYCLEQAGAQASDLQATVFYENPFRKFDRLLETFRSVAPDGFGSFQAALPQWAAQKLHPQEALREALGDELGGELLFVGHHQSHAASAFFPSPFDSAAILTLDAVGEWGSSSIGAGKGNRITLAEEMRFPHSLGLLYSAFTYYCGFKVNSGEYKLMGLAPYGEPRYAATICDQMVDLRPDGSIWMDMSYFNYCQGLTMTSEKFHELFGGPARKPEERLEQRHMDLAASIQTVCEESVLRSANHAGRLTGEKNLVMAGGVALNCVANGRLRREGPFEDIWVQPAAGDAGGALGAALLGWHHHLDQPRESRRGDRARGSMLGPAFSNEDIGLYLDSVAAESEYVAREVELLERVAKLIQQEKVVGWFHGRMEYGPRALGARSILGDPRSPKMQSVMNLKIKYRESFRPFAPVVLQEHAAELFDMEPGQESPYMLFVAPVRDALRCELSAEERRKMEDSDLTVRVSVPRSQLPVITHVDYSARIQTIDEERHGRFCRLMRRFHELTGCPVLVNTSFNVRGEPIVCSFEDAYRCFMATEMDCLVLENHILLKENQNALWMQDAEAYRARHELD